MSKTKVEMATAVLRNLGITNAVDSPSAADLAYVTAEYVADLAYWDDLGLVYWADDEIPEAAFPIITALVANRVMNTFGMALGQDEMMAREDNLLIALRRHCARRPSGLPTRVDHY